MSWRIKTQGASCAICLGFLILSACALKLHRGERAADKSPLYISSQGRDGYFFSLQLARAWEGRGGKVTRAAANAQTRVAIEGPNCARQSLLVNQRGDKTDLYIVCRLAYGITLDPDADQHQGHLSERFILSSEENLSAFYRKESEIQTEVLTRLARKLALAVETVR